MEKEYVREVEAEASLEFDLECFLPIISAHHTELMPFLAGPYFSFRYLHFRKGTFEH